MNGNYEWNRQQAQQRLQQRYADSEVSGQIKQDGRQGRGRFSFTSALSAVWQKLRSLGWRESDQPVPKSGRRRAQES